MSGPRWRLLPLPVALLAWYGCTEVTAPDAPREHTNPVSRSVGASAVGALDGTVYFSVCPLATGGEGQVYSVDPNGGSAPSYVTIGDRVRVAPGNSRLAVRRGYAPFRIVTLDVTGANERVILTGGAAPAMTWSPDGKKIAVFDDVPAPAIRIYNDTTGDATYSEVSAPGISQTTNPFDWRGGTWLIGYHKNMHPAEPPSPQNLAKIVASAGAGSPSFTDLYTPQLTTFQSYSPDVRAVRLHPNGTGVWSGRNYVTLSEGIFTGSGAFRLNTGWTQDFAFSPNGDAVAAIRRSFNPVTNVATWSLDIIDWAGPYVRTLYQTTSAGFSGAMMCTVDWSTESKSPPLAAIHYTGTGNANEFNFDGSASSAMTQGATIVNYAWDFGDGSTATGPTVTHQYSAPGEHVVSLKVTDSNGLEGNTSVTLGAKLTISTVDSIPATIAVGDVFPLHVLVRNDGAVPINAVAPTLAFSNNSLVQVVSGPVPAASDLAGGTQLRYRYSVKAIAAGVDTAIVNASGNTPSGPVAAEQRRRHFTIDAAGIGVVVTANPESPEVGRDFIVTATLTNAGTRDLSSVVATLTRSPSGGSMVGAQTPSSIARITPGGSSEISWTMRATESGSIDVAITATGTEDGTLQVRTGSATRTIQVVDRRLIVTTIGDEPLTPSQLSDGVCDVDSDTEGNQCTLRAAIQLANTATMPQEVSFNIPASGVPTIQPQSELPVITAALTIDGRSQSGGWVELSGPADVAQNGLVIERGTTVIRGMVMGGWKRSAILLKGGSNHVVTGNRFGTNASGTEAAPNGICVEVEVTGVRIGGTSGTSPGACTGDCNLVAGSNTGILVDRGGSAFIYGNWIGVDVTGSKALPNNNGITALGRVIVGGSTSSAGKAPGNLISGNSGAGISILDGAEHEISGNLIGTNSAGTAAVQSPEAEGNPNTHHGILIGAAGEPMRVVIGGTTAKGNVISGFGRAGVAVHGDTRITVVVQGNRIGTAANGLSAIPNQVGVQRVDAAGFASRIGRLEVIGNLISGNTVGVGSADLVIGNKIGTDVTGTAAIPNLRSGISEGGLIGGIRPVGSTTCEMPCNLISGNSGYGVLEADSIQGNFIGTDLSGEVALPNGSGSNSDVTYAGVQVGSAESLVGGFSGATRGVCDRACNLISGNIGHGALVHGGGLITGNVIGANATGSALPNGANGIVGYNSSRIVQNLITNQSAPAVLVPAASNGGVTVLSNSITRNGGGITYGQSSFNPPEAVITSALLVGTTTRLRGRVNGLLTGLSFTARIEVFGSQSCEPGPQGAVFLRDTVIGPITDGEWTLDIEAVRLDLPVLTATATVGGSTSPFSQCAYVGEARPRITQASTAGDTRVEVSSITDFSIGGWARINAGQPGAEWKPIKAFGSLIFSSPLAFDHDAGEPVEPALAPPAAGWLVNSGGNAWSFGTSQAFSFSRAHQIVAGLATPTGRGMWVVDRGGNVSASGDATLHGDAGAILEKGERAISIIGNSLAAGYMIVTNKGRVIPFGTAASFGEISDAGSASRTSGEVAAATATPNGGGYMLLSACGDVTPFGETSISSQISLGGNCDIVGATVPNSGVGLWVLRADGKVDAVGGAPALGNVAGRFSKLIGIAAAGDGYVVAESNGKLHGFGTPTPSPLDIKGQAAALVQLIR